MFFVACHRAFGGIVFWVEYEKNYMVVDILLLADSIYK